MFGVPKPLIRTIGVEPGAPLLTTETPVTLPSSASAALTSGCLAASETSTVATDPVKSPLVCDP